MNSLEDFVAILQDDLGLSITIEDIGRDLDQVAGWDSVHLLELMSALERQGGRPVALPDLLSATNLAEIYALAVSDRD
jgi:acyl carrier protein